MTTNWTRRAILATLGASLLAPGGACRTHAWASSAGAAPAPCVAPPRVAGVARLIIPVGDLDEAIEFYSTVLTFRVESASEQAGSDLERLTGVFGARVRSARLRLGDEEIELVEFLAPEGRPMPSDSRSQDRWFQHIAIVVSDMDRAYAHLRAHDVRHASSGPQTLPETLPNASGISAFYFKDPDGHVLEVIQFPPDKGDARWKASSEPLFLGIDHTAIVVNDTDAGVRFYAGVLGMRVVGGSENFGTEQEHLNNVFGARLRITTLKGERGPGVELLEYLAPADGRAYPEASRANDLWHWRTVMEARARDAGAWVASLDEADATWISPGQVEGVLCVRDTDGHAVQIECR